MSREFYIFLHGAEIFNNLTWFFNVRILQVEFVLFIILQNRIFPRFYIQNLVTRLWKIWYAIIARIILRDGGFFYPFYFNSTGFKQCWKVKKTVQESKNKILLFANAHSSILFFLLSNTVFFYFPSLFETGLIQIKRVKPPSL